MKKVLTLIACIGVTVVLGLLWWVGTKDAPTNAPTAPASLLDESTYSNEHEEFFRDRDYDLMKQFEEELELESDASEAEKKE